jgi:hypothetical protein
VTLEDLSRAASTIAHAFQGAHMHVDVGYVTAVIGLSMLIIFAAVGLGILLYRGLRAAINMTPGKFVLALFVTAWVLLVVGSLLP